MRVLRDAQTDALRHEAALWLAGQAGVESVVRTACDALVAGRDGDALRTLAGLSVHADPTDLETEEVIFAALSEQGSPLPERGSDAAKIAGTVAMAEEVLAGRMHPRDLARWAHGYVTHEGPKLLQDLVDIDDVYDNVEYIAESEEDIDRRTLDAARQLVLSASGLDG